MTQKIPSALTPMPTTHLLYLHGFRSSPQSVKARQMAAWLSAHHPSVRWWCPQLPPSPAAAAALIDRGTADWPVGSTAVVGSSLGGYYATWFAERRHCPAVVLNPAVYPARDLAAFIGELTQWQNPSVRFHFRPEYIAELQALDPGPLCDPARYFALVTQGDEVLDWREAQTRYAGSDWHLLPGGGHALGEFAQHLDAIARFLDFA